MSAACRYVIVDDDPLNNTICKMLIKTATGITDIKSFTDPLAGLAFLETECIKDSEPVVLLLDINMPILNGWEFMEQYEHFNEKIKQNISVYIVSSSVDNSDKHKAALNPDIKGFVSKPLNRQAIQGIAEECALE